MQTMFHAAESRGFADHGWLRSYHSFSFADYYNPMRMNFGVLRVINDDYVMGGRGFGRHPHKNMEIISIPLSGDLEHKDSMGNGSIIKQGDIQIMSAGVGITHSEMNANLDQAVAFLQIWVLPKVQQVEPRYQQISLEETRNEFQQIVSPNSDDDGVWLHQDAWFSLAKFDQGTRKSYQVKQKQNGVYVFMIAGKAKIGDQILQARDGLGVWDCDSFDVEALDNAEILLMDVPLTI